jgi:two-component system, OmpR family, KDP operon response regulator KdpE
VNPNPPLVILIEDEQGIRRFLRVTLSNHGYRVTEAATAEEGLDKIAVERPDLILLDLGLPDQDGLALIKGIREWSKTPIVVLSARDTEKSKVEALDLGADDYLTKPFSADELLARLRVALRHALQAGGTAPPTFAVGDLRVDLSHRLVFVAEKEIHLTPIEYTLLATLVKHAGKVLTHRQLLNAAWGPEYGYEAHYLRVYMAQLRRKLEADPANPRYLRTETGVGYRLLTEP